MQSYVLVLAKVRKGLTDVKSRTGGTLKLQHYLNWKPVKGIQIVSISMWGEGGNEIWFPCVEL